MRFTCLYVPNFPLQAAWRDEPEMLDRPAAVVEGKPSCLRVIAANEKARDAGVTIGMTQAAAADAGSLPALRDAPLGLRRRSEAQEQSAHAALLDCARAFSPRIEDTAVDTVLLDLEGLERLLGPASQIARQALERARELGLKIHAALAANPDTAILAARGFSGMTLIPEGEEAGRLAELPVEILNPSSEGLEILHAWGIHQLKQLAALPPAQLSERLGQEGVRWWQLARGCHSRLFMAAQETGRWEEDWELEDPAETLDALDFVLSSVLTRLSKRLAVRSLAAQELRLKLGLAEGIEPEPSLALEEMLRRKDAHAPSEDRKESTSYERTLRFPLPLSNAALFFKLWRLRLESDLPPAPVRKVTVAAEPARPRPVQGGLFSPSAPDPERLELTLARIKNLVGNGNVGSPALVDSHQPHAFGMSEFSVPRESEALTHRSVVGPSPGLRRLMKAPAAVHSFASLRTGSLPLGEGENSRLKPSPRGERTGVRGREPSQTPNYPMALRIFRPAIPAQVEWHSGQPTYLCSSLIRGKISFAAGPWRNSGHWWDDAGWNLEEWDIEIGTHRVYTARNAPKNNNRTQANPVYRVCHDLTRDEWYLQGEYD
jgi:protein ImuB